MRYPNNDIFSYHWFYSTFTGKILQAANESVFTHSQVSTCEKKVFSCEILLLVTNTTEHVLHNTEMCRQVPLGIVHNMQVSWHYYDVIMDAMAVQITSLMIVYLTVYSDADQRKHQSSASLAFVRGIHRGPVNSPHKWPVTRKMFPFDDVIINKEQRGKTRIVGIIYWMWSSKCYNSWTLFYWHWVRNNHFAEVYIKIDMQTK